MFENFKKLFDSIIGKINTNKEGNLNQKVGNHSLYNIQAGGNVYNGVTPKTEQEETIKNGEN